MAKSTHNQFKAGLFIVSSFAVAAVIFFGITGSTLFNGPTHEFTAVFELNEDVNGLQPGSDVRLGGFKVGTVQKVDVHVNEKGLPRTIVTFKTPERYKLKKDAIVAVQAGLTGAVNLNIASLGTGDEADKTFPLDGRPDALTSAIAGVGTISDQVNGALAEWRPRVTNILNDVQPRANAALEQIKQTAATANETIQQVKAKIDPAYDKYAGVADATHNAMKSVDDILGDTKGDIRKTMANLGVMTDSLKLKVPTIMDKVADNLDSLHASLDKTSGILDEARGIATNTKDLTSSAKSLLNANRSRLDEIIKSLNFTSDNLAAASTEIRHAPWRLLYKPSDGEVANANLYEAARQFADASRKMQDSAQALRDSAGDTKADPAAVQAMLAKLNGDFENYKKVEKTLWERVQK